MLVQRSPEWLEFRRSKIGSSDAAVIYEGSDLDKMKLWEKKKGLRQEDPPNEFMLEGIRREPSALAYLCNKLDRLFLPDVKVSEKHPFMMSSLDGICDGVAVEIKCPTYRTRLDKAYKNDIERRDQIQMLHHMAVYGLSSILYLVYFSDDDAHLFEYHRDHAFLDLIIEREALFFDTLKENELPYIREMVDSEFLRLESEYLLEKHLMNKSRKRMDEIEDRMKELSENISCRGKSLSLTKYMRKGNISYSQIPELVRIDLDKYRSESTVCWRIAEKR